MSFGQNSGSGSMLSSLANSMASNQASNQASKPQYQESFKNSQSEYKTPEQDYNKSPLEKAYSNWNDFNNTIDKWKPRHQSQQPSMPNGPTGQNKEYYGSPAYPMERPRNNDWLSELLNNNRRGTGWRY